MVSIAVLAAIGISSYVATQSSATNAAARPSSAAPMIVHWARVGVGGKVKMSSPGGKVSVLRRALYSVSWGAALSSSCVPLVTGEINRWPTNGGYGAVTLDTHANRVLVETFFTGASGPFPQPFYIAVICP